MATATPTTDVVGHNTITLDGDFGLTQYRPSLSSAQQRGTYFDALAAGFTTDNCGWAGTEVKATGPVNDYPALLDVIEGTYWRGGVWISLIPQTTEWSFTYCNSAAILCNTASSDTTFDGLRIDGPWDGIKFNGWNSPNSVSAGVVKNCWISNSRDDAISNHIQHSLVVQDCLLDDVFNGISIDRGTSGDPDYLHERSLRLDSVLIGLKQHNYLGTTQCGNFIKGLGSNSPKTHLTNCILSFDDDDSILLIDRWNDIFEQKLGTSRNNFLCWLGVGACPKYFGKIPVGFTVLDDTTTPTGQSKWDTAVAAWKTAHPNVPSN